MEGSDITNFFKNKSVFITGGLGFMGKVLVEKLLRSCPEIDKIYLLARSKKNTSAQARVQEMLMNSKVMSRMQTECPSAGSKIVVVEGDICFPGLNINPQEKQQILGDVSVVFHVAASVRFHDPLKVAVRNNLEGTKNTADLAKQIKNLKAFVHVSTAYSNSNRTDIDEKVYPSTIIPSDFLDIIRLLQDNVLEAVTPILTKGHPNTYTFTKLLAENYFSQHCTDLPVAIVRPAAVIAAWKEPFPGWVDNKFGPSGMLLALGTGAVHVLQADESNAFEVIPVDIGVNHMIAAAWDVATNPSSGIRVFNGSASPFKRFSIQEFRRMCYLAVHEFPLDTTYRYPSCILVKNRFLYKLVSFFQHYVPAAMADLYFVSTGQKPRVIGIYNKILSYLDDYSFFNTRPWTFHCNQLLALQEKLSTTDKEKFKLVLCDMDWLAFAKTVSLGVRRYLMHQDDKDLPQARKNLWSLYYKTVAAQAAFALAVSYWTWTRLLDSDLSVAILDWF